MEAGLNSPQQTIYHWKGNLSETPTHFRYWKSILISRLYKQFTQNAPQWLQHGFLKKKFKLLRYEHIIYSFEARDLKISNILFFWRNIWISWFYGHFKKFREIEIFRETFYINGISRSCALRWYIICSYFKSSKFFRTPILKQLRYISRKLLTKSRTPNIFSISKMNRIESLVNSLSNDV